MRCYIQDILLPNFPLPHSGNAWPSADDSITAGGTSTALSSVIPPAELNLAEFGEQRRHDLAPHSSHLLRHLLNYSKFLYPSLELQRRLDTLDQTDFGLLPSQSFSQQVSNTWWLPSCPGNLDAVYLRCGRYVGRCPFRGSNSPFLQEKGNDKTRLLVRQCVDGAGVMI